MVPTDEARITSQILPVEIWSDEVTRMGTLDITALLEEGSQTGQVCPF